MNMVIFAFSTSLVKSLAPMAWANPEFFDMLQATPCVYTFGDPSAFMKRVA